MRTERKPSYSWQIMTRDEMEEILTVSRTTLPTMSDRWRIVFVPNSGQSEKQ